jgi:type I restriction enzyme S subunit
VTVEQLASEVRYGSSAKTSSAMNDGVPVLRMGNIVDGRLDFGALKYLPQEHEEFPDLLLQSGDLLFNRTNSAELVGKTAVYRRSDLRCSLASYLIRVRFGEGIVPEYVSFFINSLAGRRWIASVVSQQVGQANVNGTKLKGCVVPMPPAAEQMRIVEETERLLSISFAVEQAALADSERSQRLRQSILKWAFEGKLVDQDPNDEPASILLDRIKAERETAQAATKPKKKPARKPRKKKSA